MIRAVVFDLWGTLVHGTQGDPYLALHALLDPDQREAFPAFKEAAMVQFDEGPEALFERCGSLLGLREDQRREAILRFTDLGAAAFPEAVDAVRRTREIARTALLSNCHGFGMDALLTDLGLSAQLGSVFLSARTGHRKPRAEAFRAVQQKLGLFPGQLAMVGDSWHDDVQGALDAGWTALWLNRSGLPRPDHDPEAELVEVQDLSQVPGAIEALQAGARCSTCLG